MRPNFLRGIITIVIILSAVSLFGQNRILMLNNERISVKEDLSIPLRTVNDNGVKFVDITYEFSDASVSEKKVDGKLYNYMHIKGFAKMGEVGKPALPANNDLIAIPENAIAKVTIVEAHSVEYDGYMIHPALKPATDTHGDPEPEFEIDENTYNSNEFFPKSITEIVEMQKIRGTQLAIISIRPVQFNPVTNKIKVYTKIKYRVEFIGANKSFNRIAQENSAHFSSLMKNIVLNHKSIPKACNPHYSNNSKDYIIVTTLANIDAADTLAEWKRQMGYKVEIIAKNNWTAQQVKDSIHSCYFNWIPRPDYFLIIGDHDDVPADEFTSGNTFYPTDLYFACIDGASDYYPDMAHGRISVSTPAEALIVVKKIIDYEKDPVNDADFYSHALNCAQFQDDDTNNYADRRFAHTSENIRNYMISLGYSVNRVYHAETYVNPVHWNNGYYSGGDSLPDELLKPSFAWNGSTADIIANIDSGNFYVLHRDHGYVGGSGWHRPYFVSNNVANLNNGRKQPVELNLR